MITFQGLLYTFIYIGLALLAGKLLRAFIPVLKKIFLPSSVIGGILILLCGPQVLGNFLQNVMPSDYGLSSGLIPADVLEILRGLPGLLISVVFAALLMGKPIPHIREIWRRAGAQIVFGQSLAWGQYVTGLLLVMFFLTPVFGIPSMAGALIEIGFEGGHGTAAGMAETFRVMGFPDGADLALAMATFGLISGIVVGSVLVNWAARKNYLPQQTILAENSQNIQNISDISDNLDEEIQDALWEKEQSLKPTDPFSIHLALVGLAIGLGWLAREALIGLEALNWAKNGGFLFFRYIPLFPMAMLGGVVIQIIVDKTGLGIHFNRRMMNRISGTALDFIIVAALGTLSLSAIRLHLAPFLILAFAGLIWNLFCVFVLAPRIIPEWWFPRAVCDFGQSTGVTVTGLLLLRMADPGNESGTLESFGYKQLLFEPIVGGGFFTAASVPLIVQLGPGSVLGITGTILVFWLIAGWFLFGKYIRERKFKNI